MSEKNDTSLLSVFITLLVEVGFFVPVVAVAKLVIVFHLLGVSLSWKPILIMALVTVPVYFGDRLFVDAEDTNNEQKELRNVLLERYRSFFIAFVFGSLIAFLWLTWTYLPPLSFLAAQFPFFIFMLYPFLKKVRHIDTVAIATAWSVELVLLAVLFSRKEVFGIQLLLVFFVMLIMKMSESELSNIRDIQGDSDAGNETFPIMYGVETTRKTVASGTFVSLMIIAVLSSHSIVSITSGITALSLFLLVSRVTPSTAREAILADRLGKFALSMVIIVITYLL